MNPTTAHGGPAFPSQTSAYYYHGMFLRDYFAAKAMQGLISHDGQPDPDYLSKQAYKIADAMLRVREVAE